MKIIGEPLPGAFLLEPKIFQDHRGKFIKTFHAGVFTELGLPTDWKEEFFSTSAKGVLRGMHFQLPPHDHAKLVYCTAGVVLDVILDLRRTSPTYGQSASVELSAANALLLYIPVGLAHGFLSLTDDSLMVYKTSTMHAPSHDAGVRWDSFGFSWPETAPILSQRDAGFPTLQEFEPVF